MQLIKFLTIFAGLLVLSSCTSTPQIITETKFIDRPVEIQVRPAPVKLSDVKFHVVTEENLEEFIAELKSQNGGNLVFIATTVEGYESISLNVADLRRYIEQQKELILYYEKSNSPTN